MGLEEKKRVKEFQDTIVPGMVAEIKEIVKVDLPIDVDWNSFNADLDALKFLEDQLRQVREGFRRIVRGASGSTPDSMALEAVKEGVKKIVIKNVGDPAKKGITLKDGVVELLTACGKGASGYVREDKIKEAVEAAL